MKELKEISNFYDFTIAQELRIESLVKDIAIGFGNYLAENYEYKLTINDEALFYSIDKDDTFYTTEIFNEYLNTLK